MTRLFWKAALAFVAMPGMVAFVVPVFLVGGPKGLSFDAWGAIPLGAGGALLLGCVREFYVAGRGTLAPWTPPVELVTSGPYRYSRNPMYVAVVLVLWGWAGGFHSRPLVLYSLLVMLAFHLRVVLGEEPWLLRTHGERWTRYRSAVPRWIRWPVPRIRRKD